MALVSFGAPWYIAVPFMSMSNSPSATPATWAPTIDAAAEKWACVFRVPKTGTLDQIEFIFGTIAQAPANGVKVSFQDVEQDQGTQPFKPDGTADEYRVIAQGDVVANTWIAPGLMTDDGTDTGNKRSVTEGDLVAAVVEFENFVAGDSIQVENAYTMAKPWQLGVAYNIGAGWVVNASSSIHPAVALKYNDGTYECITAYGFPTNISGNQTTHTISSSTNPDEIALRFKLPMACEVSGFIAKGAGVSVAENFDVILYDENDTVLASTTVEPDSFLTSVNMHDVGAFDSPVELEADTEYRLAVKPLTTPATINFWSFTTASAAIMNAAPWGSEFYYSQRVNGGAWTDTTTRRPFLSLIISKLDDGANVAAAGSTTIKRSKRRH